MDPKVIEMAQKFGIPYEHHLTRLEEFKKLQEKWGPCSAQVREWQERSAQEERVKIEELRAQIQAYRESESTRSAHA